MKIFAVALLFRREDPEKYGVLNENLHLSTVSAKTKDAALGAVLNSEYVKPWENWPVVYRLVLDSDPDSEDTSEENKTQVHTETLDTDSVAE